MKSMTSYAYKESRKEKITVSAELKCYNSRFLDCVIHLPSWLAVLESDIRKYIGERFVRGKVEVGIKIKEEDSEISVNVNSKAAMIYHKAISSLAGSLGLKEEASLKIILGMEGVIETETKKDEAQYWELIEKALALAITQAETERVREGEHTKNNILSHLKTIEDSAKTVEANVPALENDFKEKLRERFTELLGEKIDDNRILAETAVLLVKYSIAEELSRLSSHLKEFRLEIERNPSPGKKLDFLSQEMNREVNTIGSKTPVLEVSRAVIEMKNALENIREQLRNVE